MNIDSLSEHETQIVRRIFRTLTKVLIRERKRLLIYKDRIGSTVEGEGHARYTVMDQGVTFLYEDIITWKVIEELLDQTDWNMIWEPKPSGSRKYADLRVFLEPSTSRSYLDFEFKRLSHHNWGEVRKELAQPGLAGVMAWWESRNQISRASLPNDLRVFNDCFALLDRDDTLALHGGVAFFLRE